MDIWKVNEFMSWSQNMANVGSPSYLKQKTVDYVYEA